MHRITVLGGGGRSGGVGGSSFTTFNSSISHANIVLSNGDLTATRTGANAFKGAKSDATFNTGTAKIHCELTLDNMGGGTDYHIPGIVRVDQTGSVSFPGENAFGLGFEVNDNIFYNNSGSYATGNPGTAVVSDVIILEFGDGEMKVALNTGSYVTATYPAGLVDQDVRIMLGLFSATTQGTMNFGASPWVKTPTAGYAGLPA